MPRTRRYIFNTLTVVSAVLLLGTVGLWADVTGTRRILSFKSIHIGTSPAGSDFQYNFPVGIISQTFRREFLGFHYSRLNVSTKTPRGGPPNYQRIGLVVPHWFLTLIFTILPTIWLFKWNKRRKLGPNACLACGYDLTGNESGQCPECGAAVISEQHVE